MFKIDHLEPLPRLRVFPGSRNTDAPGMLNWEGCLLISDGAFNPKEKNAMKRVSSTLISATALVLALSLTAAQAEPQQGGMSTGSPAAGNSAGGDHPSVGRPDQPDAATGSSDQMNPGTGKGKSAEGTMPSEGQPGKGVKDGNDTGMKTGEDYPKTGNKGKGKSAEGAMPSEGNGSKDAKAGDKSEGLGSNTAEGKSGTNEAESGKSKTGATADSKGDRPGKSVRLESNDVSKVRTYFSQHRPSAHRIDRNQVSVSIGVGIPSAIVLYELPTDVIVVSSACPIKYFVWEDDIVLVDSCTHEVVEIISDAA